MTYRRISPAYRRILSPPGHYHQYGKERDAVAIRYRNADIDKAVLSQSMAPKAAHSIFEGLPPISVHFARNSMPCRLRPFKPSEQK